MKELKPVNQIEVQVLIDNVTDSLSTGPKKVTLEWPALMKAGMRELAGSCQCCANHGLSLVITARRDGVERKMLFDDGISRIGKRSPPGSGSARLRNIPGCK
jgi:7,8-dihydropterin-6-yl-methyl-4-(beta-D-ribofuranosyl)aminobenzene 5'-phosphate synthase